MTDFRRRRYLVNKRFQLRFMAYLAGAVLLSLSILYLSNYLYFDLLIDEGKELGLHADHPYYGFIEDQRQLLTNVYLGVSICVFFGLMVFGLFLSHRIAGPIYRVERYMEAVSNGHAELQPVRLREGDFFPELADIVNHAVRHQDDPPSDRRE